MSDKRKPFDVRAVNPRYRGAKMRDLARTLTRPHGSGRARGARQALGPAGGVLCWMVTVFGGCMPAEEQSVPANRNLAEEMRRESSPPVYAAAAARRDSLDALWDSLEVGYESLVSDPRFEAVTDSFGEFTSTEERRNEIVLLLPELSADFELIWSRQAETMEALNDDYWGFQLFTECAPVKLAYLTFGPTAFYADSRRMAESRLRAARIWGGNASDFRQPFTLQIDLSATQTSFYKEVWDPLSGAFRVIEAWESNSRILQPVTSQTEAALVMQRVSILLDDFILLYLRVNEGYCP